MLGETLLVIPYLEAIGAYFL